MCVCLSWKSELFITGLNTGHWWHIKWESRMIVLHRIKDAYLKNYLLNSWLERRKLTIHLQVSLAFGACGGNLEQHHMHRKQCETLFYCHFCSMKAIFMDGCLATQYLLCIPTVYMCARASVWVYVCVRACVSILYTSLLTDVKYWNYNIVYYCFIPIFTYLMCIQINYLCPLQFFHCNPSNPIPWFSKSIAVRKFICKMLEFKIRATTVGWINFVFIFVSRRKQTTMECVSRFIWRKFGHPNKATWNNISNKNF